MRASLRVRQVINLVNLSTLLGLLIAGAGRARVQSGPDGLLLARGYRLRVPRAPAFTVGNVILLRLSDEQAWLVASDPLQHEARHATQYAVCIGPVMLPLYFLAAGWLMGRACSRLRVEKRVRAPCRPGRRRLPRSAGRPEG